jgi:L-ascorbate metabolism protein UlaG (beta-lactamase superfamily)
VKTPDGVIWHPGDTRLIDELLDVKDVDVLFFDVFGVDSHLGPEGSARLAASSGAKVMVAYHYGTLELPAMFAGYDPEDAQPYIQELAAKFLVLNPGEPLELPLKELDVKSSEAEPLVQPPKPDEETSGAVEGGEPAADLGSSDE